MQYLYCARLCQNLKYQIRIKEVQSIIQSQSHHREHPDQESQ